MLHVFNVSLKREGFLTEIVRVYFQHDNLQIKVTQIVFA